MENALQTVTQDSAVVWEKAKQCGKKAAGVIYLYNLLQFIPFK